MLNFIKYLLIILLNSGLHIFSMDFLDSKELQFAYNKYDQTSQLHIEVPKNLCELYKLRNNIFECNKKSIDLSECQSRQKDLDKKIATFCYQNLCVNNSQDCNDKEILSIIQRVNCRPKRHPFPGRSGAEIYIFYENNITKPKKIAKIFRCQSKEDLKQGFLELSNSLVVLGLNPDPLNIKMARIFSAGYFCCQETSQGSDIKPYTFCMLLEEAPGKSIKQLLSLFRFYDTPILGTRGSYRIAYLNLIEKVLKSSAQYMSYFHVQFYKKFIEDNEKNTTKNTKIREYDFSDYIDNLLPKTNNALQDIESDSPGELFDFEAASQNIADILVQECPPRKLNIRREDAPFKQHLKERSLKLKNWYITSENKGIAHRDMNTGNLIYADDDKLPPSNRIMMIDLSTLQQSIIQVYEPIDEPTKIDDPAKDVGKFLTGIWNDIVFYRHDDRNMMESFYRTLYEWQNIFLKAYMQSYILTKAEMHDKQILFTFPPIKPFDLVGLYAMTDPNAITDEENLKTLTLINHEFNRFFNVMATFRERVYSYKLCLYDQIFSNPRIKREEKDLVYYFFLRESGLLDQVINRNSSNANTEVKINKKQSSSHVVSINRT